MGFEALVSGVGGPVGEHRSCGRAGLAAYDYPVYAGEVQIGQGGEEGFEGEELDGGGGLSQVVDAKAAVGIFDGDAHIEIFGPGEPVA